MQVKLVSRECFDMVVGHRVVGTFIRNGHPWNAMQELAEIGYTGKSAATTLPGRRDIYNAADVSVMTGSADILLKIDEYRKNPDPGAVEYASWFAPEVA